MSKQPVQISLKSRQQDGDVAEVTEQTHHGHLYHREGTDYLVYNEEGFSTQIRLDPHEIRLFRRGEINAWQVFQLGEITGGHMAVGEGEMVLRILTSHFAFKHEPAVGELELHYEMWTGKTPDPEADLFDLSLGKFDLQLSWEAVGESEAEPGDG